MPLSKLSTLLCLCVMLLASACSREAPRFSGALLRQQPWGPQFVEEFGALPLQNEGRVQPFSTLAAFTLYAVHGRRDVQFRTDEGATVKLSPTEWLLDVWCFPRQAANYPLFRIENVGVLEALGMAHEGQGQRFEYLSYAQLLEKGAKLEELAERLDGKKDALRTEVEKHIVQLWRQLMIYHRLHQQLRLMQGEYVLEGDELKAVFGGRDRISLVAVLQQADAFRAYVATVGEDFENGKHGNLAQLLSFLQEASQSTPGPLLLPPVPSDKDGKWHTLGEIVTAGTSNRLHADAKHLAMLGHLQQALLAEDLPTTQGHLLDYKKAVAAAAEARGDYETVALESYYYAANWHFHAMMTFLLGFLLACVCWVMPRNRLLWWASVAATSLGLVLLTMDVWIRCLITGHPPITRLYDTFLFIGGVSALVLLLAEFVLPRRIALSLAPFVGALLVFFARLFEVADGQDTMKPLQAVLLSNFWLGIHVPTMNIGYASGLAASIVAMAWVAVRALSLDQELTKVLAKVTYGITCFSLATSVVGTILGGVWANDSWGRFWGWDPKENGALLICLSQIALLHARMSGMVRDAGFVLWSIGTGMIVVFSWFHTNLLGVGLHAYGFSGALHTGVWISYTVLLVFLLVGAVDIVLRPNPVARGRAAFADMPPLPAK